MIRFTALFLFAAALSSRGEPLRHPLDALTAKEYWTVFETMKASGKLDGSSRYAGINLHEPPKADVLRWHPGEPFRREALAIVKQGRHTFEAVVDVAHQKLTLWKEIKGVEKTLNLLQAFADNTQLPKLIEAGGVKRFKDNVGKFLENNDPVIRGFGVPRLSSNSLAISPL